MKVIFDQYYPQLTGVRALAAYFIFLHHYPFAFFGKTLFEMQSALHIGVPIFFTLSGFLIYLRYAQSCRLEKEWLLPYFKNRFARIYPVYFLVVLLHCWFFGGDLFQFLMQISFIRGFSEEYKFLGVAQGWSLTVEESFYFLFPFLLFLIKRVGFLIPLLAIYGVGSLLLKGGTLVNWHSFFMPELFMNYYTFFGQAGQFFMGMYLAKWISERSLNGYVGEKKWGILTLFSFCGLIFCVYCFTKVGLSSQGILINHTILPCFIVLFFYGLLTEKSWVRSILQSKFFVILGKSSYIFYLIHVGVFSYLITTWVTQNKLILFVFLNVLSVLLYFIIELPCQKFFRNFRWKLYKQLPTQETAQKPGPNL